jgi:hypothetical protein
VIKAKCSTRTCRGIALIQRSAIPIRHGFGALAANGVLARVADAAGSAAFAPTTHKSVAGKRDRLKGRSVFQSSLTG